MNTEVTILSTDSTEDLENKINSFLNEDAPIDATIKDIKFSTAYREHTGFMTFSAMIIYTFE